MSWKRRETRWSLTALEEFDEDRLEEFWELSGKWVDAGEELEEADRRALWELMFPGGSDAGS